jgi:hypothetical protein
MNRSSIVAAPGAPYYKSRVEIKSKDTEVSHLHQSATYSPTKRYSIFDNNNNINHKYLHVAMALEVENGKAADIAHTVHMNSKFPKEIDNLLAAAGQAETENQWCEDQTHKLE